MTISEIEKFSGSGLPQTCKVKDRLVETGIIREITGRKQDRVWAASDLLGELDEFDRRIHDGMR